MINQGKIQSRVTFPLQTPEKKQQCLWLAHQIRQDRLHFLPAGHSIPKDEHATLACKWYEAIQPWRKYHKLIDIRWWIEFNSWQFILCWCFDSSWYFQSVIPHSPRHSLPQSQPLPLISIETDLFQFGRGECFYNSLIAKKSKNV